MSTPSLIVGPVTSVVQASGTFIDSAAINYTIGTQPLIVVTISGGDNAAGAWPLSSVVWQSGTTSGTLTKFAAGSVAMDNTGGFGGAVGAEIWYCVPTGNIVNGVIRATKASASGNMAFAMSVRCYDGATLDAGATAQSGAAGAAAVEVSITPNNTSSYIVGAWATGGSSAGFTANAQTTENIEAVLAGITSSAASGISSSTTTASTPVTIGASSSYGYRAIGLAEVHGTIDAYSVTQDDDAVASDAVVPFNATRPVTEFQHTGFQANGFVVLGGSGSVDPNALSRTQIDQATATDSEALAKAGVSTQTDTATATDSEATKYATTGTQTDSATARDTEAIAVAFASTQADTAVASDTQALALGAGASFSVTQTDSAVASDSEAIAVAFASTQTDTATATDTEATKYATTGTQTDTATATDSEATKFEATATQTDQAVASDSEAIRITAAVTQADTATATDAEAIAFTATATQTDQAVASDSQALTLATTTGAFSVTQTDIACATDALGVALAFAYAQSDTATATDSVLSGTAFASAFTDKATASDSLDLSLAIITSAALQDSAVASDAWAVLLGSDTKSGDQVDTAVASDALAVMRGSTAINQTFRVWSGAAWVYWDGSGWAT